MKDFLPTGDTESKAAEDAHVAQAEGTKVAEKDLGLVPFARTSPLSALSCLPV